MPTASRNVNRALVTPERRERGSPTQETVERDRNRRSPDFGGGTGYCENDGHQRGHIPEGGSFNQQREHIPENERRVPPRLSNTPKTPLEEQVPRGCSLHSMEPLREWFCKALCQLEDDTPDTRQYNVNIREERWTNFSLEGVRFPAMTVDVIQRGEALAIFERDHYSLLTIHFQQIQLYTYELCWAASNELSRYTEEWMRPPRTILGLFRPQKKRWHPHAEGILMVALTTLNLPIEAWKSARLLRAVPNCRLVLMLAYHMLSPALSVEETGLMAYLQAPPEAGRLQNWKCARRRLVEIGGRLPTATQLHQSFIKILSKHLAANKKENFVFQQQSSTIPMMNPSPTEIVELFSLGYEKSAQSFLAQSFSKSGTSRPKSRDIPATPCLKQQKKATCIKFLSRISRHLGPGCPRNIPPKNFMFRLFFRT